MQMWKLKIQIKAFLFLMWPISVDFYISNSKNLVSGAQTCPL